MSKITEEISVNASSEQIATIIRKHALSLGSLIENINGFEIKDTTPRTVFSTSWPATVKIEFEPKSDNTTIIHFSAKNFGFGPIQTKECKSRLGVVKSAVLLGVEELGSEPKVSDTIVNSVEEIKKYKELLDMGAITQQEYEQKKKQLLSL